MQSPSRTRFEQMGRSTPAVIVCDDADAWVYSPPLHKYRKELSTDDGVCSPIIGDWRQLPNRLQSPVLAGGCGSDPSAQPTGYALVTGFSEPELASVGRVTRNLCIDPDRKVIVWEKWESRHSTRLYIYSTVNRDAKFTSDFFAFEPPAGSTASAVNLPTPRPLGTRAIPEGPGVSLPRLVSKKDPKYGAESRKAHIEGTVVLYVVIGPNGTPAEVLVYRPLSPDLDLEAVRCVQRWRFAPGVRDGQPVACAVMIEVNFRLR